MNILLDNFNEKKPLTIYGSMTTSNKHRVPSVRQSKKLVPIHHQTNMSVKSSKTLARIYDPYAFLINGKKTKKSRKGAAGAKKENLA